MTLSVNLPKKVAIRNRRLAMLYFSMVGAMLFAWGFTKFIIGNDYVLELPIVSQLHVEWGLAQKGVLCVEHGKNATHYADLLETLDKKQNIRPMFEDTDKSIDNMENFYVLFPEMQYKCDEFRSFVATEGRLRWGHSFNVRRSCTKMCTMDQVLLHEAWSNESIPPSQRLCWTDFKAYGLQQSYTALQFMENRGKQAALLTTAKSDWVVNHITDEKSNLIESVPQGMVAQLKFTFKYTLPKQPPWFFFTGQSTVDLYGTDANAKTLILDASGAPWGDLIPAGAGINLRVHDVLKLAASPEGYSIDPWDMSDLSRGAEVASDVICSNTDADIVKLFGSDARRRVWSFGASLKEPVCVLRFTLASTDYQSNVNFGPADDAYTSEVVSETNGVLFTASEATGVVQVLSFNVLMMEFTSIFVLLAIPTRLTSFIASRMLGPISKMYRRVMVESYDIEDCTASTLTVLASNTSQFDAMRSRANDGTDVVKLSTIYELFKKDMKDRASMNERETMSLALFCYDAIVNRTLNHEEDDGCLSSLDLDVSINLCSKEKEKQTSVIQNEDGITLDQFNQARMDGEKVTFDALVLLFDKDRRRGFMETFFTPDKIKLALDRACDEDEIHNRHWLLEAANTVTDGLSTIAYLRSGTWAQAKQEAKHRRTQHKASKTLSSEFIEAVAAASATSGEAYSNGIAMDASKSGTLGQMEAVADASVTSGEAYSNGIAMDASKSGTLGQMEAGALEELRSELSLVQERLHGELAELRIAVAQSATGTPCESRTGTKELPNYLSESSLTGRTFDRKPQVLIPSDKEPTTCPGVDKESSVHCILEESSVTDSPLAANGKLADRGFYSEPGILIPYHDEPMTRPDEDKVPGSPGHTSSDDGELEDRTPDSEPEVLIPTDDGPETRPQVPDSEPEVLISIDDGPATRPHVGKASYATTGSNFKNVYTPRRAWALAVLNAFGNMTPRRPQDRPYDSAVGSKAELHRARGSARSQRAQQEDQTRTRSRTSSSWASSSKCPRPNDWAAAVVRSFDDCPEPQCTPSAEQSKS